MEETATHRHTAIELLAQRYAGGEIDDVEYFQRLSALHSKDRIQLRFGGSGCADRP
ncbi:MAG TPA: hypothetical protein VK390_03885 [Propionibacteriaceae bacterium]|nr:hypothetical protein [Propionibacteriaceae bacterium]